MYHFVALIWNAADPAASAAAAQLDEQARRASMPWENLLTAAGISVFAPPPTDPSLRPYVLPARAGVVLGKLFAADPAKASFAPVERLDESTAREILRTGGEYLVQNFWGGYVAL